MVNFLPSKQTIWVRFPLPALKLQSIFEWRTLFLLLTNSRKSIISYLLAVGKVYRATIHKYMVPLL